MHHRGQRTIRQPVEVSAVGFFTAADATIRFLPAPAGHGIAFQRIDCRGSRPIPARIEFAPPRRRRTALQRDGVCVETVEHALAALTGLEIDNCLVEIDGPEVPGCDGSARQFVDALLEAGVEEQDERREIVTVETPFRLADGSGTAEINAQPIDRPALVIDYQLDYGPDSPIPRQSLRVEITQESFVAELALARTFVLDSEVAALRASGYGRRTTARDLLVYGSDGVIDNELRFPDECVRHKILDCLGDFALLGCSLYGYFRASRSGHRLNRDLIRRLAASSSLTSSSQFPLADAA